MTTVSWCVALDQVTCGCIIYWLHFFIIWRRDRQQSLQATVKRSDGCSLPQSGRQMEDDWSPNRDSKGNISSHRWEMPTWSPQMPYGDVGGVVGESLPCSLLDHHGWGCRVSGWGAAWEKTDRQIYPLTWLHHHPCRSILLTNSLVKVQQNYYLTLQQCCQLALLLFVILITIM